MQEKTTKVQEEAAKLGLKINIKKTKTMKINIDSNQKVNIGNEELEEVNAFTYLGSEMTTEGGQRCKGQDRKSQLCVQNAEQYLEIQPNPNQNQT